MRKFLNYFLQGLLIVGPIAVTIYILFMVFNYVDTIIPFELVLPFRIPGLGLLLIILLISIVGYLGSSYAINPFMAVIEKGIERAPLVKLIYSSIKDLIAAFVGEKKRFNHPVLVTINKEAGIQRIGFITQNDLSDIGLPNEKVAVYFPFSYSFAGELLIVPKENIAMINASGTEMMKFVISGGVTEI